VGDFFLPLEKKLVMDLPAFLAESLEDVVDLLPPFPMVEVDNDRKGGDAPTDEDVQLADGRGCSSLVLVHDVHRGIVLGVVCWVGGGAAAWYRRGLRAALQ